MHPCFVCAQTGFLSSPGVCAAGNKRVDGALSDYIVALGTIAQLQIACWLTCTVGRRPRHLGVHARSARDVYSLSYAARCLLL